MKKTDREAPTVTELCDAYLISGCGHKKASTLATDRGRIERHIKPLLGKRRVKDLRQKDIQKFHDDVAAGKTATDQKTKLRGRAIVEGGKGTAARTVGLLGGILTFAVSDGMIVANPARGIKRARDRRTETFLSSAQFFALGAALVEAEEAWAQYETAHNDWVEGGSNGKAPATPCGIAGPPAIAAVRLLILTGCRKSEILTAQWSFIDYGLRLLRLHDSKTGQKDVRLATVALEVLSRLKRIEGNPYVIPGAKQGHHFVGLPRAWVLLRTRARLGKLRIHDLRHSFASVGAAGGHSLLMIGKLLGHADTSTTQRYAHLGDDPIREAADRIADRIDALMTGNPASEPQPSAS